LPSGSWPATIIVYSPKTALEGGEPLQAFTAIGQIVDAEPYRVEVSTEFAPWRRNVDFLPVNEAPIRPLIDDLNFIENKKQWGYKFRFGVFKIDDHDLEVINKAMAR
jgi:hypothetical protein